ncbi:hypothetical protein RhiirA5_351176, partial [Rhizophagus irregularis]
ILADLKRQFKRKKVEESDIDSEILEEVAEEEAALVKLAKNQIYRRKQAVKEAQEAEKRAAKTWSPALVSYPIYKPPETWWYKTYNKILNETEQTKLRPKLTKRKYTLEERLKYYKRNGREPPLYVAKKSIATSTARDDRSPSTLCQSCRFLTFMIILPIIFLFPNLTCNLVRLLCKSFLYMEKS